MYLIPSYRIDISKIKDNFDKTQDNFMTKFNLSIVNSISALERIILKN